MKKIFYFLLFVSSFASAQNVIKTNGSGNLIVPSLTGTGTRYLSVNPSGVVKIGLGTVARKDTLQTFSGVQTFSSAPVFSTAFSLPGGTIAVSKQLQTPAQKLQQCRHYTQLLILLPIKDQQAKQEQPQQLLQCLLEQQ